MSAQPEKLDQNLFSSTLSTVALWVKGLSQQQTSSSVFNIRVPRNTTEWPPFAFEFGGKCKTQRLSERLGSRVDFPKNRLGLQGKPHHPIHKNVPIQEAPAISTLWQHYELRSQSPQPTRCRESVQEVLWHPESTGCMPDRNSCPPTPVVTASFRRAMQDPDAEHVADIDETPKRYRAWSLRTSSLSFITSIQCGKKMQCASIR